MNLRALQTWFASVVMNDRADDPEVRALVTGTERMDAHARMGVYTYAYRARLVECLADDYGAVKGALGEETFASLCADYIAQHPSERPNLNGYGARFASFFRGRPEPWAAFAADLATLEWAMVEAVHAEACAPIGIEALQAVPPEQWENVRLPLATTVRLLRLGHPANAWLQSFRDGEPGPLPGPANTAVAVYREGFTIWRMDLTPPMIVVLEALARGATLGEALAPIEEQDVMVWFRNWMACGFFARLDAGA